MITLRNGTPKIYLASSVIRALRMCSKILGMELSLISFAVILVDEGNIFLSGNEDITPAKAPLDRGVSISATS